MDVPNAGVLVLGSVNVDHLVYVDRLPAAGETLIAADYAIRPGGKGRNQAVAIARLGGRVAFVGTTGDDPGGVDVRADLISRGVDTAHLLTAPGQATGLAMITIAADGENTIVVHPGANSHLSKLPVELFSAGHAVLLCSLEIPLAVVADATARARTVGVTTVVNAAPMRGVSDGTLAAIVADTDVLVVNETEAGELVGATGSDDLVGRLTAWRSPGAPVVVMTRGADGAVVIGDAGVETVPSPVVTTSDTVGAGDVFSGMLALALASGRPVHEAVKLACAAGAVAVSRPAELSARAVAELG